MTVEKSSPKEDTGSPHGGPLAPCGSLGDGDGLPSEPEASQRRTQGRGCAPAGVTTVPVFHEPPRVGAVQCTTR